MSNIHPQHTHINDGTLLSRNNQLATDKRHEMVFHQSSLDNKQKKMFQINMYIKRQSSPAITKCSVVLFEQAEYVLSTMLVILFWV